MMAKTKFIIIVVVILSIFLGVGYYISRIGNQYSGPAVLTVTEEIGDLGTIGQDKPEKYIFILKNDGGEPLIIDRVITPCSCTATVLSEEKLLPGKTTELEVTFNPRGFSGEVTHSVYIYSNDENNSRKRVAIKAFVEHQPSPKIVLSNNRWNLGLLSDGDKSTHLVNITNEGDMALIIENIVLPIEVKYQQEAPEFPKQLDSGEEIELDFIFDSTGQEIGVFTEYIRLITNDPNKRNITLRIEGYIKEKEEIISISTLQDFTVPMDIESKVYESKFLIRNNSDNEFRKIILTPSENYIRLSNDEISLFPGEEKVVTVSVEEQSFSVFDASMEIQDYIYINIPVPLNLNIDQAE